jgi:hypothetical protein
LHHFEVLLRSVQHGEAAAAQQRCQAAGVDCQRVDQHVRVAPLQLHQGKARKVRPLAVELGIKRV